MNKARALQIAVVGSLALSMGNVGNPGAANAATGRTTSTVATRPKKTVARPSTTTAPNAKKTVATTRPTGTGAASLVVSGARRSFSATRRCSFVSNARYTSPMPP